nr:MAG: nucleotide modification associated domain 1 [Bacteriophage sp.]
MKYKYHKGSEADFDGAPQSATVKLRCGMFATVFADSFTNGATRTDMISGRYNSEIKDIGNFQLIAHREPLNITEVDAWMQFTTTTESLITERGSRYGKFKDGAEIMQSLKDTMRDVDGWNNLTASQKEALDMIQHKIGRILNGDPTYDDSWKDIAGYATLIVNELNGEVK